MFLPQVDVPEHLRHVVEETAQAIVAETTTEDVLSIFTLPVREQPAAVTDPRYFSDLGYGELNAKTAFVL